MPTYKHGETNLRCRNGYAYPKLQAGWIPWDKMAANPGTYGVTVVSDPEPTAEQLLAQQAAQRADDVRAKANELLGEYADPEAREYVETRAMTGNGDASDYIALAKWFADMLDVGRAKAQDTSPIDDGWPEKPA